MCSAGGNGCVDDGSEKGGDCESSSASSLSVPNSNTNTGTSPNIGINIGTVLDFDNNRMFADAMKSSRAWGSPTNAGSTLPTSDLDADGWPTQDASLYVWGGIGSMQGTYALSFTGQATVSPSSGTIANQAYNSATNHTTAALIYTESDPNSYLTLAFTNTKRTLVADQ